MQKNITELSKLKDINDLCKSANINLIRVGHSYSSILAICDLIEPTLKNTIENTPNYFKLNAAELRKRVNQRENTIYSMMCVIHELGELAMNIDGDTATISSAIEDINDTVTGINAGINSVLKHDNEVSNGNNSVSNANNSNEAVNNE